MDVLAQCSRHTPCAGSGTRSVPATIAPAAVTVTAPPIAGERNRPVLVAASIVLGLAAVIALVVGIIRITTPEGDYVIETDDPTFAFSVSKGTVILEDKLKKRTYEVRVIKNKGKGEWELEVLDPANDLAFKAREFTIKRGETVALKMWFDRKEAAVAKGTPVDDAWIKMVQAMPPEKQVDAVAAKLMDLNAGFDGKMKHHEMDKDNEVTRLEFWSDKVKDISPVCALAKLNYLHLHCATFGGKGLLSDLAALKGLKLKYLRFDDTLVTNLEPLIGMDLDVLELDNTPVANLTPLSAMKLRRLSIRGTNVTNLVPLENMQLSDLFVSRTKVSDLTPIKKMPLKMIECDPLVAQRNAEILRSIPTLDRINEKPAAEFWKEVDANTPGPLDALFIAQGKSVIAFGHPAEVIRLAVSPDGKAAATACKDGSVHLWDLLTGKHTVCDNGKENLSPKDGDPSVNRLFFLSNQEIFLCVADRIGVNNGLLWDLKQNKLSRRPWRDAKDQQRGAPCVLEVPRRAEGPIMNSRLIGGFQQVHLERSNGEYIATLGIAGKPALLYRGGPSLSADGKRVLADTNRDQRWNLWDTDKPASPLFAEPVPSKLADDPVDWGRIAPDGRRAAFAIKNQYKIVLWDFSMPIGKKASEPLIGHGGGVNALEFSPSGQTLLSGSQDGKVILWDLAAMKEIRTFKDHTGAVTAVAFTPDSGCILSTSTDKTLRFWKHHAASAVDDVKPNSPPVGEIRRYLGHQESVRCVTFSPDGKSFLSGSFGELWLWDVDSTTERVRFPNTHGHIQSAAFSPDGERVIGPAQIGSVIVWDAKPKPGEDP